MPTPARRPWAWIVVVLLIDIALAAAGVWMLAAGLDDSSPAGAGLRADPPQPATPREAATPEQRAAATPPSTAATPPSTAPAPAATAPTPPANPPAPPQPTPRDPVAEPSAAPANDTVDGETKGAAAAGSTAKPAKRRRPAAKRGSANRPVDPYDAPPEDPLPPESR